MSSYLMRRKRREEEERLNPKPVGKPQTAEEIYGMPEGADLTRHLQQTGKLPTARKPQGISNEKGRGDPSFSVKAAAEALQRIALKTPPSDKGQRDSRATDTQNRLKQVKEYQAGLQTRLYAPTEADQKRIDQIGVENWRRELMQQTDTLDNRIKSMRLQQAHDIANAAKERKGYNEPQYRQSLQRREDVAAQKEDRQSEIDRLEREYSNKSKEYYASRATGGYNWVEMPKQKQLLGELEAIQQKITEAKGAIKQNKMEIESGWGRWVELATKDGRLTEAERAEAKEAAKLLRKYRLGEDSNLDRQALAAMLENRSNSGSSLTAGLVSAIPGMEHLLNRAGATASQHASRVVENEALASALRQNNPYQDVQNVNPKANLAGRIAGDVAVTAGVGSAVKGATEASKAFGRLAPWVQHIIQSAGTFGVTEALQSAGNMQTPGEWDAAEKQKAEAVRATGQTYEPQVYSLPGQLLNVGKRAGIAALGGGAGGAVGYGVGKATGMLLQKAGLQVPFMEAVRQTLSGTAAAAANTGATYALTPEDQRPSKEQVLQDVAVAYIFSALTSSVDTYKTTQANKQALDGIVASMQREYGRTLSAARTPAEQAAALERVEGLTAQARQLLGRNYMAGQQKYVNSILDGLDAMDEQVALARQRLGAPQELGGNGGLTTAPVPLPIPPASKPQPIPYAPGSPEEAAYKARQATIDGQGGSGYTDGIRNAAATEGTVQSHDREGTLGVSTPDGRNQVEPRTDGFKIERYARGLETEPQSIPRGGSEQESTYTRTTEEKGRFLERVYGETSEVGNNTATEGIQEGDYGRAEAYNRRGDHEPIGTFQAILSEFERREFGGNKERHGEALGTFIRQGREAGKEIRNEGNLVYSYREATTESATLQALETQQLLEQMEKKTVLIDGPLEEYQDGTVLVHNTDAMTGPDNIIYIRADTEENPHRIAFHELYHELTRSNPEKARQYFNSIYIDNVDVQNPKYQLMQAIAGRGIFGKDYMAGNATQKDAIFNEIAAQLAGEIEDSSEQARYRYGDMVKDFSRVEQAWYVLRGGEVKKNGREETTDSRDDAGRAGAIPGGNERISGQEGSGNAAETGARAFDATDYARGIGGATTGVDAGRGTGSFDIHAETGRISEGSARTAQKGEGEGRQLTRKGETYLKHAQQRAIEALADAMDIPKGKQRELLAPLVGELTEEIQRSGTLSQEAANSAFEKIYGAGVKVLDDFYNNHRNLQRELRATRLQISEQDQADIDDFEDFRRNNRGRLTITSQGGIPVDVKYMELASRYPELFSAEITHPADQLQRIAEVQKSIAKTEMSLDQYYGADAGRYKKYARYEFDQAMEKLAEEAGYVQRYENDRAAQSQRIEMPAADLDAIRDAYKRNAQLQKESQKATAKYLLTEADSKQVERLLGGEITPDELPSGANRQGILEVYKAKKAQQDNMAVVRQYRGQLKEARRQRALDLVENADAWKDKKMGFAYSRETAERNIQDIMGKEDAARINDEYFRPVHQAEAESVRLQNRLRDHVRDLHISQKFQYPIIYKDPATGEPRMTKASESTLVQLLGEKVITPGAVRACGADADKIQHAVDALRKTYNTLLKLANDSLIRNGYAPVEYRKDYFPHFQDNKPDSVLAKVAYTLGMKVEDNKLPTDIAGLTHTFKPGKKWVGNFLRRQGKATTYDALAGFDRYLNGATDVIFHTDNIQGLRSLESALRYKFSDEGTQAEIDEIRTRRDIDELTRESMLEAIYERDRSNLPNLVTWLRNYTDLLAGKKHPSDRAAEHEYSRKIYGLVKALEGRIAANMVALNINSWLTNFIPITQGAGQLKTVSVLKAMKDSLLNEIRDDGFVDASDFLTNRRGVDPLIKGRVEKISETLTKPMFYIDDFTANTLVRARYAENIDSGMDPVAAMQDADAWTAGIMADRSKGATPTLFNKKNPIAKAVTMFQLEVNNQLSYLFKDIPNELREKGKWALIAVLMKAFVGAYLFNELSEKLTGRRPAMDPINMVNELIGDATGYQLPDIFTLTTDAVGALQGEEVDPNHYRTEKQRNSQTMLNATENIFDQVPFVSGLIGGGRIPISSAFPDVSQLRKLADKEKEVAKEKKRDILLREIGGTAGTYLLLPFGGGQVKKVVEAADVMRKGGSYTMNDKGERQLQFLADQTPGAALKAATFGKYSLPQGQEYIKKGFNKLSVKQTAVVDEARKRGMDPQAVKDLLDELKGIEAIKDDAGNSIKGEAKQKREMIAQSGFSTEDKNWLDSQLISDGFFLPKEVEADYSSGAALGISEYGPKLQEKAINAKKAGIDEETFLTAYEAQRNIEGDKGKDGQTIYLSAAKKKKAAVDEATPGLSRYKRQKLYEILGISKQVW